jgi:hypothetical protein
MCVTVMFLLKSHTDSSTAHVGFTILQVGRGLTLVRTGAWRLSRWRLLTGLWGWF